MVDKGDYYECPNDGCKGIRDIGGWHFPQLLRHRRRKKRR
jgi:hypothetical protein